MATHRIHVADLSDRLNLTPAEVVAVLPSPIGMVIDGEEAKHAVRVKRVQPGHPVVLFDAAGTIARGTVEVARRELVVRIEAAGQSPPLRPAIDLITATPKGPRLDKMVDQLSQAGVRSWTPLDTRFGVVDPRETRLDRMERIALESAKQSGRAWAMAIGERTDLAAALTGPLGIPSHDGETGAGQREGTGQADRWAGPVFVCDGSGTPLRPDEGRHAEPGREAQPAGAIRVLIGPEGGFAPDELDRARAAGARILSLGPTILRIETAAVVAAGLLGWAFGLREGGDH
jgi:16S rRNA (uracil1498-N3)-methyltransferase